MQTTTVKLIVPDGKTPRQFKNEIKAEALRRDITSQEFCTLAVCHELSAKQPKAEGRK